MMYLKRQLLQHAISLEIDHFKSICYLMVKLGHLGLEMSQLVQHAISRSHFLK